MTYFLGTFVVNGALIWVFRVLFQRCLLRASARVPHSDLVWMVSSQTVSYVIRSMVVRWIFGLLFLTVLNICWIVQREVEGDLWEFFLASFISCSIYPLICIPRDGIYFFVRYRICKRRDTEDLKLGKLWGMKLKNIRIIRKRNGGSFPEEIDIDTLREFRKHGMSLDMDPELSLSYFLFCEGLTALLEERTLKSINFPN